MKRKLAALVLMSLFSISSACAQTVYNLPAGMRTITTVGDADVFVTPDKSTVMFQVQTYDKSLQRAYQLNEAATKAVIALAPKYNVMPENVQTSQMSLEPQYGESGAGPARPPIGYFVNSSVSICLHNPAQVPDLIREALGAGANTVQSVSLETSKERQTKDEARVMALKAAKEKAAMLAGHVSAKLGKAIRVEEGTVSSPMPLYANAMVSRAESSDAGSSMALGRISVHAQVSATFELVE